MTTTTNTKGGRRRRRRRRRRGGGGGGGGGGETDEEMHRNNRTTGRSPRRRRLSLHAPAKNKTVHVIHETRTVSSSLSNLSRLRRSRVQNTRPPRDSRVYIENQSVVVCDVFPSSKYNSSRLGIWLNFLRSSGEKERRKRFSTARGSRSQDKSGRWFHALLENEQKTRPRLR